MFDRLKEWAKKNKTLLCVIATMFIIGSCFMLASCQGLLNVNGKDNYITLGTGNENSPTINNGNDNTIIKK